MVEARRVRRRAGCACRGCERVWRFQVEGEERCGLGGEVDGGRASRREAGRRHDPDGDRRRPREPLGRRVAGVQDGRGIGRRSDTAAQQQHGHLQELRGRSVVGAELPDGRRGQGQLRDRRVRDHRFAIRDVPEHGRSGRQEPAPALRRSHEPHGLAEVRLHRVLLGRRFRLALRGRLSGVGSEAVRLRGLPARGRVRQLAVQRQGALEDLVDARALSSTSPTRCGSPRRPSRACTT